MEKPHSRIRILEGDITKLDVEAIVNAANESLLGGGGVDGAIHRAAGPALLAECRTLGGCPTGQAKVTGGYDLKARYIMHTVGPVYRGGSQRESVLLESCYNSCLELCREYRVSSVAFPAISTGVYGYPISEATEIAVKTVLNFLEKNEYPKTVIFVCFNSRIREAYEQALARSGKV